MNLDTFREVWSCDFEFKQDDGELPIVHCMVAIEHHTKRELRLWADALERLPAAPFSIGSQSLFVAYFSTAEFNCFQVLGWALPENILDLFVEFSELTNGLQRPMGRGLLACMNYFGLGALAPEEKDSMRQIAMRGAPFTPRERQELLDYCASDARSLDNLLPKMTDRIHQPYALLRGQYMATASAMECRGIPFDVETFHLISKHWEQIKLRVTERVNNTHSVYHETERGLSFSTQLFADWLEREAIPWPRLPSGALDLSSEAFRNRADSYPIVQPLHELRSMLGRMRLFSDLAVGSDGRNRCMLSPFRARTSRNQPSNAKFVFGPSKWIRSFIKPGIGRAVAYVDWCQQEHGIAATMSGDNRMIEAYLSGDPYLAFAKQSGAVPVDATKQSHPEERRQFKVCSLAVQYGMSYASLAQSLGVSQFRAKELLRYHRETYPTFWEWSERAVDFGMLHGELSTVYGWRLRTVDEQNPRSLANFPCQANGAEMLRAACILIVEAGIHLCAPIHDAVLIEADADSIGDAVRETQSCMQEASRRVLDGFELSTDAEIVRHPDRYRDERGGEMWDLVVGILSEIDSQNARSPKRGDVSHMCAPTY